MDNYKKTIKAFAKQTLGGLAGEILLEDYCKRYNISDLSVLDEKQKKRFVDAFIWGVFHNHMPKKKIDSIRLHINLLFSLDFATERISDMVGKKIILNPLDMKYQSFENFEKIINNLEEGVVVIPVHLTGYVTATMLIFIFRDSAIKLGNIMLQTMMGVENTDNFLDDMKQSAVKEFFNIVLPTFADTVANTLNQEIFSSIPDTDITDTQMQIDNAFSKMNFDGTANYGIKKIMSTPIGFVIDSTNVISGLTFLLLETEPDIISDSLDSTDIKTDDTLESMDLEKIEIPKDSNRYKAIIDFMRNFFGDDPAIIIDNLMEDLGISSLNNVSVGLRRQFVKRIIDDHFAHNSPKVVDFITHGCEIIFNIGIAAAKKDDGKKSASDMYSKLLKKNDEKK